MAELLTYEQIKKAVQKLKEADSKRTGYTYILPSPNKGKSLLIHGWIGPLEATQIVLQILRGEKKIEDFETVTEIDNELK